MAQNCMKKIKIKKITYVQLFLSDGTAEIISIKILKHYLIECHHTSLLYCSDKL